MTTRGFLAGQEVPGIGNDGIEQHPGGDERQSRSRVQQQGNSSDGAHGGRAWRRLDIRRGALKRPDRRRAEMALHLAAEFVTAVLLDRLTNWRYCSSGGPPRFRLAGVAAVDRAHATSMVGTYASAGRDRWLGQWEWARSDLSYPAVSAQRLP